MSTTKRIDEKSLPAVHSGLNLFSIPPTNASIVKTIWRELLPLNAITGDSPHEFRLFSDNLWVDLSNVYLYLLVKLEKKNKDGVWVPIEEADTDVGSIQSFGQSYVQTLKMHLMGTETFNESLYPFMAYMKNALSYSEDVRSTKLAAQGYFTDGDNMDVNTNSGFKNRVALFSKGRLAEFMSKLEFDLANQEQYLLNNTDILFTIYKADDNFLVQSLKAGDTNTYRFKVEKIKLYVKTIDVQPSVNMAILSVLDKTSAKYAVRKTEMRSCYISPGRTEISHNIFTNVVPRRLIIGLVNNKAYKGDKTLNPFKFEHFDLRDICVEASGQTYPTVRYDLRFKDSFNQSAIRPFVELHESLNLTRKNVTCGITFKKFKNGWTFFIIPMTATLDDNGGFELVRNGTTTIKLTFNSPIPDPGVALIALGEFDQIISIDENRVVTADGTV